MTYLLASPQCTNYEILNEASRNRNHDYANKCDKSLNGNVWYRMKHPAGTKIPEEVVPMYKCGTHVTGWMNGQHPTVIGEEVKRKICFNWNGNSCLFSRNIKVTNCGAYYVYKLPKPDYYSMGYCAE